MKKNIIFITSIGAIVSFISGVISVSILTRNILQQKEYKIDKFKGYYYLLNHWLTLKQNEKFLETYFKDRGYNSIAIYGMGELGNHFYEEMKNTDIEIKYAIDKNASTTDVDIEIINLEDELPKVDVIVVTATFAFDEIYKNISTITDIPVVSLDDIVYGVDINEEI